MNFFDDKSQEKSHILTTFYMIFFIIYLFLKKIKSLRKLKKIFI